MNNKLRFARPVVWLALAVGLVVSLTAVKPVSLPTAVPLLSGSNSHTVPEWYELNSAHYGQDATFSGGNACSDFPITTTPGAPHYDGFHFVITPDNTPYNVNDWQIVFRDNNGAGAVHKYRIQVSGSTVTATPSNAIRFSKNYTQIQVITPTAAHYRLVTATDAALQNPSHSPYDLTMYAHSADPNAVDIDNSPGKFNLSGTCGDKAITLFPHSDCDYPDDASVISATSANRVVSGTLTCNGNAEAGETVRFTTRSGVTSATTTSSTGAFSKGPFASSDFPVTVSFSGSQYHAAAPSVSVNG